MDKENNLLNDLENLLLEAEDGKIYEYEPLMLFDVEGSSYMAFLPVSDGDGEEIIFFGVREVEDEVDLIPIEDDAEYELVGEAFLLLMQSLE